MTDRRNETSSKHPEDHLDGAIDGALHLLDRQVIDSEGGLCGKVDDVELTDERDGLEITGLLTGAAALLPRIGGAVAHHWRELKPAEPLRARPWRIDMSDVDHLDSAVHLSVPRAGALRKDRDGLRLSNLTGMDVLGPDGTRLGRVLDVRFRPGGDRRLVLRSLIVGRGRPGSLLGYDRRGDQGPWLVRTVVRRLHRHTVIALATQARIDWEGKTVKLDQVPHDSPGPAFD
jgi:sporulation protein YlmC with PRC-barrel domain